MMKERIIKVSVETTYTYKIMSQSQVGAELIALGECNQGSKDFLLEKTRDRVEIIY